MMTNQNDDVIRKTKQYLEMFSQIKDFQKSKKMRKIHDTHSIPTELFL